MEEIKAEKGWEHIIDYTRMWKDQKLDVLRKWVLLIRKRLHKRIPHNTSDITWHLRERWRHVREYTKVKGDSDRSKKYLRRVHKNNRMDGVSIRCSYYLGISYGILTDHCKRKLDDDRRSLHI